MAAHEDPPIPLRSVKANGITMRIAELGEGALVLVCHGFPMWRPSSRRQLCGRAATR